METVRDIVYQNSSDFSYLKGQVHLPRLFYIVDYTNIVPENEDYIHNLFEDTVLTFLVFTVVEQLLCLLLSLPTANLQSAIANMCHGAIMLMGRIFVKSVEYVAFTYVHARFRAMDLPSNTLGVFLLSFLAVEFTYYWGHRLEHETKLFWGSHMVHHSSETYEILVGFRLSATQSLLSGVLTIPLALFFHPLLLLFQAQMALMYQYSIHTNLVGKLGVLDYILNTPSAHRVHHGSTRDSIDKNFGAVTMIWDHVFNTFQAETMPLNYGLTTPNTDEAPLNHQFGYLIEVIKDAHRTPGMKQKFKKLFYGPGWSPGKPRLGDPADLPEYDATRKPYELKFQAPIKAYAAIHFVLSPSLFMFYVINGKAGEPTYYVTLLLTMLTIVMIDLLLRGNKIAFLLESGRCALSIIILRVIKGFPIGPLANYISAAYIGSMIFSGAIYILKLPIYNEKVGDMCSKSVRKNKVG